MSEADVPCVRLRSLCACARSVVAPSASGALSLPCQRPAKPAEERAPAQAERHRGRDRMQRWSCHRRRECRVACRRQQCPRREPKNAHADAQKGANTISAYIKLGLLLPGESRVGFVRSYLDAREQQVRPSVLMSKAKHPGAERPPGQGPCACGPQAGPLLGHGQVANEVRAVEAHAQQARVGDGLRGRRGRRTPGRRENHRPQRRAAADSPPVLLTLLPTAMTYETP